MPKETTINDIYDMRVGEPISYLRAGVKSIGDRRHGPSQFKDKPEWSFQGVVIYDLEYPDDTITAMFKDCPPVPDEYVGQVIIFEASKSGTGLKAEDDAAEKDGPLERVLWVTRSAHVCTEEEASPSRETRRPPARETRAPARESRQPAREEPPVRTRRREPEPEPRRREPEPARTREPEPRREASREEPPRQQQPQQQRRHVEPSAKLLFFQMSLMFIEAHKAAKYAAEQIVLEEQKTTPSFKMEWTEFCHLRTSLAIEGFRKNLHTQMRPPPKPKTEEPPSTDAGQLPPDPQHEEEGEDDIPYD